GQSNLMEGSTLTVTVYQFGTDIPNIDGEMEVDHSGNFEFEIPIEEEALDGTPVEVEIGYHPEKEDEEAKELYGEEGEKLTGPFVRKYTNTSRTRYGAIANTVIELTSGEKQSFEIPNWSKPDDYGELDI